MRQRDPELKAAVEASLGGYLRRRSRSLPGGVGRRVGPRGGYAAGRLSVEVNARGLVAHEDTAYEEWGFSGSIAYTPSEDGRGLSMRLGSAWGGDPERRAVAVEPPGRLGAGEQRRIRGGATLPGRAALRA